MLVLEFIGGACGASSNVFFSEGVPSVIRSSGCERERSVLASGSLRLPADDQKY